MKSFKGCRNNVTGMPVFNNWSSNIRLDQLQSGVPFSMPCPSKRELPATSKRGQWEHFLHGCLPKHIKKYGIQTVWKLKQSRYKDIPVYQTTIKQPPLGYYDIFAIKDVKTAKCHFNSSLNQRPITSTKWIYIRSFFLTKPTVAPGGDISAPHRRTQWYLSNSAGEHVPS